MFKVVVLHHPQSAKLLNSTPFHTKHAKAIHISCGTTKVPGVDYSESNDFFPTYASWNSILFETSVILTVWEHADELIGNDNVAFLHTDTRMKYNPAFTWKRIGSILKHDPNKSIGLTVNAVTSSDFILNDRECLTPKNDPMFLCQFGVGIRVWDYIKEYDPEIYEWAMDVQPTLICAHQFACTRSTLDYLGPKLYEVARKLRLRDTGLWTPHMFERLIALYLAKRGDIVCTSAFLHHASSGVTGPGEQTLYGPKGYKFFKICTRWNQPISIKNDA